MSLPVANNRAVHIEYILTDDEGALLDASGAQPLGYLQGHGNILDGLATALEGKSAGDEVEVHLTPEQGYGVYKPDAFESIHRNEFPKGTRLDVGAPVWVEGSGDKSVALWVTKIQGARVTVTTNHPLAGKALHFRVKVRMVREATSEEIAHGHIHEPGHAHD